MPPSQGLSQWSRASWNVYKEWPTPHSAYPKLHDLQPPHSQLAGPAIDTSLFVCCSPLLLNCPEALCPARQGQWPAASLTLAALAALLGSSADGRVSIHRAKTLPPPLHEIILEQAGSQGGKEEVVRGRIWTRDSGPKELGQD